MSSWNDVTKKVREIRKNFVVRCAISFVAVLASALLQSYVILAFIRPAGLLSSGFTGLAILIDRIAELYGFTVSTSLALVVLNLPVALMCCRSINVKFTVFSLLQVFFASFFLNLFRSVNHCPHLTTITGIGDSSTTCWLTLPIRAPRKRPRPRLPITTISTFSSAATFRMASCAEKFWLVST